VSEARDEIFANIRRSLGVTGREAPRLTVVEERLDRAPKGLIPARGQGDLPTRLDTFRRMVEASLATVVDVASPANIPAAVAQYLRDHNLPATLRMGHDSRLGDLDWSTTSLDVSKGASDGRDLNGISHALGGVAESGTLVLVSGPDNPTTLNFLPDNHIVVVRARDIEGDYEALWDRIRFAFGKGTMPRVVNWVTGPSRSGDIEQTLLLGAHGPRRLHVILVGA
jgi:L-lactate dehydrogenase complex protein LldG